MIARYRLPLALLGLAILTILISLYKGSTYTPFDQLLFSTILFDIRLPRTLAAFAVGGLLALSGSLMQLLLHNPLADPYALGVSGGAAFVSLLLMLLGMSGDSILIGAWLGSLLVLLLLFLLSRIHHWQAHTLILMGIALACASSAGISFVLLLASETQAQTMLFWLMGDLNGTGSSWFAWLMLVISMGCCLVLAPGLNILSRGELVARSLGLATERYRIALFLLSGLCTATAVTQAGCIGFVGVIVPHLASRFFGQHHRFSLPASALIGGSLLTLADTAARTWFAPQQIPVGIVTALVGVPIFIGLLAR